MRRHQYREHPRPPAIRIDPCSSALSATATWRWGARSGDCSVRADIRSMSRVADISTCFSRRSGGQSTRAILRLP